MTQDDSFLTETSIYSLQTTLGDLIQSIISIAIDSGRCEEESYYLTSVVLNELLLPNAKFNS